MKFARRAEGIKSARTVFKRAREDARCKHHVYVAAALMEYYCTKDKNIAFRIFELGLKKFGDNPDYILCYIDYLSHLNGKGLTTNKLRAVMWKLIFLSVVIKIGVITLQRITTQESCLSEYYLPVVWNQKNQCMYRSFVDLSCFNSDLLQINTYCYENIFFTGTYGIGFWNSNLTLEI